MKLESMEFMTLQELAEIASYRARIYFKGSFDKAIASVISENLYATASALGKVLNHRKDYVRQEVFRRLHDDKYLNDAIQHDTDMRKGLIETGNDAAGDASSCTHDND